MRLISGDRRRRVLLLSKRLAELAVARREILIQLEALDAQASAARLEQNYLHNMDAPVSNLPEEVIAMIFEEGVHLSHHFGVLVSHVSQRWRNVALATPKLWRSVWCIAPDDENNPPYLEQLTRRASTFLSRARPLPTDIIIGGFRGRHFSSDFLQLISDHIGHCRQLRIVDSEHKGLMKVLKCISSQPTPLLASIDLSCFNSFLEFHERLFSSGVPRLTTARIVDIDIQTIHLCLPAFESLQSLQLTGLYITTDHNDVVYRLLRDALVALPSLCHLEVFVEMFIALSFPSRLPMLLPGIQHLHARGGDHPYSLGNLLRCIQAPSLVALSLSMWNDEDPLEYNACLFALHFPSLQHLILIDMTSSIPDLTTFARRFPQIERLTFKPGPGSYAKTLLHNIDHVLDTILCGAGATDVAQNNTLSALLWPNLQSIALSPPTHHFDVSRLQGTILKLQAAGHPIRKLLLPREVHPAVVEVRQIIDIEEFYVDWPTPFDWGE